MPTYEYRCKDCGHDFETVQSFSDEALTECPTCGGALRKVFGNVGISFKGSGFYKTDHGSKSKTVASNGADSGGSDSSSSGDKSSGDKSSSDKSSGEKASSSDKSSSSDKPSSGDKKAPSKSESSAA